MCDPINSDDINLKFMIITLTSSERYCGFFQLKYAYALYWFAVSSQEKMWRDCLINVLSFSDGGRGKTDDMEL